VEYLGSFDKYRYATMCTSGPGWVLFAITTRKTCAEQLTNTRNRITESMSAQFSLLDLETVHTRFKQVVVDPNPKFEIIYEFLEPKTLSQRMQFANQKGETVNFKVYNPLGDLLDEGTTLWRFTNGPIYLYEGKSLSGDDGSWGVAVSGDDINGNGNCIGNRRERRYGHENCNSGDSTCRTYYMGSKSYTAGDGFKSFMYLGDGN